MSKGEGKNNHKGTEAGFRDITKRGFILDAQILALPVPANTNDENVKNDDGSFSFGAALLAPPNSTGVGGFSFVSSTSSTINDGTGSVSGDKGAE